MKSLLLVFAAILLVSCASQKEKEIKAEARASQVSTHQGLGETISEMIQSSKTLSPEQKSKLEKIFAHNKERAEELTERSYRFRSVLIKSLLSGEIDKKEINIIKDQIQAVEALRLKNTFETVDKVSNVVLRTTEKEKLFSKIMFIEKDPAPVLPATDL